MFLYTHKVYVIIDNDSQYIMIRSYYLNQGVPNLFRIREYLEKSKFEFSRFYCTCIIL